MPDIGKLEELCQILELSLDQLLGVKRQAENVQKVMDYTNGKADESLSLETIGDVAPLMKPDMLSHLAEDIQDEDMNLGELCGLAPFVGAEVLDGLAARAKKVELGELCGLAPFLTRETLGILAERVEGDRLELSELPALMSFVDSKVLDGLAGRAKKAELGELCSLAPFLTRETLGILAERVEGDRLDLGELCGLTPFVSAEVLDGLAARAKKVELGELCGLAPFLTRKTLESLVMRVDENRLDLGELCGLAPFVGTEVIGELAKRIAKNQRG